MRRYIGPGRYLIALRRNTKRKRLVIEAAAGTEVIGGLRGIFWQRKQIHGLVRGSSKGRY